MIFCKLRRLSIIAGYVGYAMIVVLSLLPAQARPHTGVGGEYEHWIAYALVGGAFAAGYFATRTRIFAGLALTANSAILELLQNFIPGRTPELTGFLASSLGAWIGIFLAALAVFFLCGRTRLHPNFIAVFFLLEPNEILDEIRSQRIEALAQGGGGGVRLTHVHGRSPMPGDV